jgi:hypothetical protein
MVPLFFLSLISSANRTFKSGSVSLFFDSRRYFTGEDNPEILLSSSGMGMGPSHGRTGAGRPEKKNDARVVISPPSKNPVGRAMTALPAVPPLRFDPRESFLSADRGFPWMNSLRPRFPSYTNSEDKFHFRCFRRFPQRPAFGKFFISIKWIHSRCDGHGVCKYQPYMQTR